MNSRFLKQTAHTGGTKLFIFVSRFALVYLLAHIFAPEDYGAYALVTTITTFGTIVLGLNLYNYVYRATPGHSVERRVVLFKSTFLFEVVLSGILLTIFLLSGTLLPLLHRLKAANYAHAFIAGCILLAALIAFTELQHYLWAKTDIEDANRMDLIAQASWIFPLLALWYFGLRLTVTTVVVAQVMGVLLGICYAFRRVEREWWRARPDPGVIRAGLAFSVPMMVPGLSFYVLKLADRFILSHYRSLADVGLYSFAYGLLNTIYSFSVLVILNTFLPYVFEAHNRADRTRRNFLLTYTFKACLAAFGAGAAILLTFSHLILKLLARQEYLASRQVLPLLAVGFLMIIAAYPGQNLLLLQNRTVLLMCIDMTGLVIGLALDFLLIPRYSFWGAAVASALAFGLVAILKLVYSRAWREISVRDLFSLQFELRLVSLYLRSRKLTRGEIAAD